MESKSVILFYGYSFLITAVLFLFLKSSTLEFLALMVMLYLGISYFRYNILHPFVWLSGVVFIYNVSFCMLDIFGFYNLAYVHEILLCTYLSIVTLFIFSIMFFREFNIRNFSFKFLTEQRARLLYKVLIVLGVLMILYLPLFIRSGYTSKKEMNLDGGLPFFGIVSRLYFLVYTLYLVYFCHRNNRLPVKLVVINLIISLGAALIIGERDVFLSIALFTFLVYYYFFKVSFRTTLVLMAIGMMTVAILQTTKQITNKKEINLPFENMFEATIGGEFATSGSNLSILFANKNSWKYQYGDAIINDFNRSVIPDFISRQDNTSRWFNQKFNSHLSSGYGMGFSYIGEGYVQFGYLGVVIWSVILGCIVLFLYKKAQKYVYGFVSYIYMIGMILYAMRGDLSYIISPLIKQVLLTYILLKVLFTIFYKNEYSVGNLNRVKKHNIYHLRQT